MSWYASDHLDADGEIQWERDIWNDILLPDQWMELVTLQKEGYTVEDMDVIAQGVL